MSGEKSSFKDFFSNPVVGFVGSAASVISLALAIYFYLQARVAPDLRYFVNPARAVVVDVRQASRLAITLGGLPVKRNISAAQIAFWNEGHGVIRPDDVLRQLVLKTSVNVPIIDATLRKSSRDVVRIELDRSRLALGEVVIRWNILEFHDGGVIQIIYLGDVDTTIRANAAIVGQRLGPRLVSPSDEGWVITPYTAFEAFALLVGILFLAMETGRVRSGPVVKWALLAIVVTCSACWIFIMYRLSVTIVPPFGF